MTHSEIRIAGRKLLLRAGYSEAHIGVVLPHWIDGFKRGVRSMVPKRKGKK
jgi:hypothetical protein